MTWTTKQITAVYILLLRSKLFHLETSSARRTKQDLKISPARFQNHNTPCWLMYKLQNVPKVSKIREGLDQEFPVCRGPILWPQKSPDQSPQLGGGLGAGEGHGVPINVPVQVSCKVVLLKPSPGEPHSCTRPLCSSCSLTLYSSGKQISKGLSYSLKAVN